MEIVREDELSSPPKWENRLGNSLLESRTRSLAKGLTWRLLATLTTVSIAWLITDDVETAFQIGFIEVFAKIAIYYLHERAWARFPLGISNG